MSFFPDYVCKNPSCKNYGHSHPHCTCGVNETSYAHGGAVEPFCSKNSEHDSKCEHFADGGITQENMEFHQSPDLAIDHAVMNHGLHHTLTKTGKTKSEDPGRVSSELLDSSRRGRKSVETHSQSILDPKAVRLESNEERSKSLDSHLGAIHSNPELGLDIGGNLGDHFPGHHAAIAAKAGTAINYLQSIKPHPSQAGPLDNLMPPSKSQQKNYQRQVALIEDPKLIFQHAKDGTLIPQDFQTLSAVYPKLRAKIQDKAFETLAKTRAEGRHLTHAQKRKLGALIGEPVTYQQSPAACQAIMHANAPAQMPQPPQKGGAKKATGVELKQINKVDSLALTPLQKLQTSK